MKKIYLLLILPLLLQSCLKDEKDLFSESAADRIDNTVKADRSVLIGAENGWIISLYPESNQIYGGYTLFAKFNSDNTVNVSSELYAADSVITSYYDVISETGPLLTFNTYNAFVHYFSDPKNPDGIGTSDGGMKGDYEFIIIEATAEKVTLKGKKSGNTVIMTPIKQGLVWKDYMTEYINAVKSMSFDAFIYENNGKSYSVNASYRTLIITENGETKQTVSHIITPNGYEFYSPIEIDGASIPSMTFDQANKIFTNGNAKLTPVVLPLNQQFVLKKWYFSWSNIGTWGKTYWNAGRNGMLNTYGHELYYANIGTTGGEFTFAFAGIAGTSVYNATLNYDAEFHGNDTITMVFNFSGNNNGVAYHNAGASNFLKSLGYSTPFTFKLTSDNDDNPSWVKLEQVGYPSNSFIVYKKPIYYPYNN